jgi:hypothetical protein
VRAVLDLSEKETGPGLLWNRGRKYQRLFLHLKLLGLLLIGDEDAALGCKIVPLPTPPSILNYCCPCQN